MKRHKRLWEKVASPENLLEAALDALRGKRCKRAGAAFFEVWEKEVVWLARELEAGSYRPGEYHYLTIHEPKQRVVAARSSGTGWCITHGLAVGWIVDSGMWRNSG